VTAIGFRTAQDSKTIPYMLGRVRFIRRIGSADHDFEPPLLTRGCTGSFHVPAIDADCLQRAALRESPYVQRKHVVMFPGRDVSRGGFRRIPA
jgi:hypothetical protein